MKYYEMHEDVYQSLKSNNFISWDKEKDLSKLLNYDLNNELQKYLGDFLDKGNGKKSLDLGTGTGPVAIYLATVGFNSTGYDISPTAIDMAKTNAKNIGVNTTFVCCDIYLEEPSAEYDLIVDSSFLHCIVTEEDRAKVFNFIKKSLKPGGKFFIHTMVDSENMSCMTEKSFFLLENEVLWSEGKGHWNMKWEIVNGKKMFPHRKIRTVENLEKELLSHGFIIENTALNKTADSADLYIGVLSK